MLAYDEETGEQAYKEVVRLFRKETEEWYHITANGEELVCTGGHPFFVKDKGFVSAKNLSVDDILRLSNGALIPVSAISVEKLENPETTYNFEVADFHTYYVGESEVLVHNKCISGNAKYYSEHESRNSAFRAAKRDAGIPMSEQPTKVIQSVDKLGKPLAGRTYIFGEGQNAVQIMEHAAGHVKGGIGPHFNVLGSKWHYLYP